jgi:hypothetical protein
MDYQTLVTYTELIHTGCEIIQTLVLMAVGYYYISR